MRCMKISTALLAVPLCLGALACENPTDTEQPEALTNPPAPLFSSHLAFDLGNGCEADNAGVTADDTKVTGTSGDDIIDCTGSAFDLSIKGRDGDDEITGGDGEDHIHGGKGNDTCNVGPGDTAVQCETINGDTGVPDVGVSCDLPDGATVNGLKVTGTSDPDFIDCTLSTADLRIDGLGGGDKITGGSGDDFIKGGDGDDTLNGGPGDDNLFGGKGNDTCNGGTGTDNAHPSCETVS